MKWLPSIVEARDFKPLHDLLRPVLPQKMLPRVQEADVLLYALSDFNKAGRFRTMSKDTPRGLTGCLRAMKEPQSLCEE